MQKQKYKILFDRSFSSKESDFGNRSLVQSGDCVTFFKVDTFMTRIVDEVNGLIITTIPFPNEKRLIFQLKEISQIARLINITDAIEIIPDSIKLESIKDSNKINSPLLVVDMEYVEIKKEYEE